MPVELAGLSRGVTVVAGEDVRDDPQCRPVRHGDHAFGEVLVGGVVGVAKQHDLHVLAAGLAGREVDEAVAVGVLQARASSSALAASRSNG